MVKGAIDPPARAQTKEPKPPKLFRDPKLRFLVAILGEKKSKAIGDHTEEIRNVRTCGIQSL